MSNNEVSRLVENYLKKVERVLPDSFETDDLIDEIRAHIMESLQNRIDSNPSEGRLELLKEVLDSLGEPEEIAAEWGKAQSLDEEDEEKENRFLRTVLKQFLSGVVVVFAAWFVSSLPNSIVDFWTALIVLMIFVIAEYFLRSWQKSEST
ncbi:MAG: hypothetical protein ACFFD3_03000, partial [Candidatus Thorarchaeota archaeon]